MLGLVALLIRLPLPKVYRGFLLSLSRYFSTWAATLRLELPASVLSFGLFCNGLEIFDKAHEEGVFEKVFTTNGVYQSPALLSRDWYQSVELSKYLAYFLDTINHDLSVSSLLDSSNKIDKLLKDKGLK